MEKLILSKYLLTGDGTVKKDWGVRVVDSLISDIDSNVNLAQKYPQDKIFDMTDKILSPGFINSHMHLYGILSHGITPPVVITDFESFLNDFWWPCVEDRLTHDLIKKAVRMAGLELINSGVTTVCDILEAPMAIPGALEQEAEVIKELGLRAILSFEACERVSPENAQLGQKENLDFYLNHRDDELISGMGCVHTTFTCSEEFLNDAMEQARKNGAGLQLHLSESQYEVNYCLKKYGIRPVELYSRLGILGKDLLVSQAVKVASQEIDLLRENGVRVTHLPLSNCEVGGGVAPVVEMLSKGVSVGLGTDGYINNFFEVMRGCFLIHKAHHEDPSIMPAETVYQMATSLGARVVGIDNIGELKRGNLADLITIKIDAPTPITMENIFDQLILYHNPQNVSEVFIHGKLLKEDGKIIGHDLDLIKEEAREAAEKLWGEMNEE